MNLLCVAYESLTQGGITVEVPNDAIYMFSGFTHPRARGRGLATSSILQACTRHHRGRSVSWAWVDVRNRTQRALMRELGFRLMGTDELRTPLLGRRTRTRFSPH